MKQKSVWILLLLVACTFAACGESEKKSSSSNQSTQAPPAKTGKEKLPGQWTAVISFSNEKLSAALDALPDDAARDRLNSQVESLMGSVISMEFGDDGKMKTTMPVRGQEVELAGTWKVTEDNNDSVKVTMVFNLGDQEMEKEVVVTFKDDDKFTAPFDPPAAAKGIYYLDASRDKAAN